MIWDDAYLDRLSNDGAQDMCNRVACLFHRFAIEVQIGASLQVLPVKSSRIRKITWKGKRVYPISQLQMMQLDPRFAHADSSNEYDTPTGIPQYYVMYPTNVRAIRFWPSPSEQVLISGDDVNGDAISTDVIVSCFRNIDPDVPSAQLPDYIYRRSVKAYVLWKAFLKEGVGQDLKASDYYRTKYEYYVTLFEKLNSDVFVSKRYALSGNTPRSSAPSRPRLPSRYEQ